MGLNMEKNQGNELFASSLEENLKKACTEMLVLNLLSRREYFIGELTTTMKEASGGVLSIVFPYGAIYRLCRMGYITESKKRNAPDGRLRQYYCITDMGRQYLDQQLETYWKFSQGISAVLSLPQEENG